MLHKFFTKEDIDAIRVKSLAHAQDYCALKVHEHVQENPDADHPEVLIALKIIPGATRSRRLADEIFNSLGK
jgi:D-hexose-6-phosphate mutarotase